MSILIFKRCLFKIIRNYQQNLKLNIKNRNYLITSSIGFLTYGIFGLFTSPLLFLVFNNFLFKKSAKKSKWVLWFIVGTILFIFKPSTIIGPRTNFLGEVFDPSESFIKNQLVNGIKECLVRDAGGLSTNFLDVPSFNQKNIPYKIEKNKSSDFSETCFSAVAKQHKKQYFNLINPTIIKKVPTYPTYIINYDPDSGNVSRLCDKVSKFDGCKEDNTW